MKVSTRSIAAALGLAILAAGSSRANASTSAASSAYVDAMAHRIFSDLHVVADMHWHKGEYCHIVNLNRMILSACPHDTDTVGNTGWLLWSMNRDDEAVTLYEAGAKANPNTYYVYDELGYYYYQRKKDWQRAIANYELAARQHDCPNAPTLHMLAHAYERNHQLEKALATWQRAANRGDDPAAKVNMARVRRALNGGQPKT